ncbi:hypothetical protein ACWDR7_06140 [Microbacterium sp. NPDC003461]
MRRAGRFLLWPIAVIGIALAVVGGFSVAGVLSGMRSSMFFGNDTDERSTEVITAVTRQQQVALLSLAVQGISQRRDSSTFLGIDIPGSERASFMQYAFTAKLGVDGDEVRVEPQGAGGYVVTIPDFVFIGHDDASFELVTESNGVLSWITPEIDQLEMVTAVLSDDVKADYIEENLQVLREQSEAFYRGIIVGVDPEADVTFRFADTADSSR